MDEALQVGQQIGNPLGRGRDEGGIAWARATDPVLRTAKFTRLLAGAADPVEQQPVGLAQHADADWQALRVAQLCLYPAKGTQVIGDFFDVFRVADLEPGFLVEQVGQRGLGTLDLRGEQRLLANRAVEQPLHRRNQSRYPSQARQRQLSLPVQVDEAGWRERRFGWGKWLRHKGTD